MPRKNPAAVALGRRGGKANTPAQQAARAENGKKGGAPRKDGHTCERCRKRHLAEFVWLELDTVNGTYHEPGSVPPERSQGLFPFGAHCAKKELAAR
jgi:hypothetical protein